MPKKLKRSLRSLIGGKKKKEPKEAPRNSIKAAMAQQDNKAELEEMIARVRELSQDNVKLRSKQRDILLQKFLFLEKGEGDLTDNDLERLDADFQDLRDKHVMQETLIGTMCATIESFSARTEPMEIESLIDPPIPSKPRKQIPITVVEEYEDLPAPIRAKLENDAQLPVETLRERFEELLYCMHFCHKETWYMTQAMRDRYDAKKACELPFLNFGRVVRSYEFYKHLFTQQHPSSLYKKIKSEGKGGFGKVDFAKKKKGGQQVAIKKLKIESEKERRDVVSEASFLRTLNHENIVKFVGLHPVEDGAWLVMEYVSGGNLKEAIGVTELVETHIAFVMEQVLLALEYMHMHHFVHRDLKAANIMLTCDGDVKIVDLGLVVDMKEGDPVNRAGSKYWMSPECILDRPVSYPADIWSLGMTLLEIALRCIPNKSNMVRALFSIATGKLSLDPDILLGENNGWSSDMKDFLGKCLQYDPSDRPTASELLQHPFIKSVDESAQDSVMKLVQYCWTARTELF